MGINSRGHQDYFPSRGSRGERVSLPCSASRNDLHGLKSNSITPTTASHKASPSLTLTLMLPSYNDPLLVMKPVIIRDTHPISRSFITSVKSVLPWKETYS